MPRETKPTGLARVNSSKERDKSNGGSSSPGFIQMLCWSAMQSLVSRAAGKARQTSLSGPHA